MPLSAGARLGPYEILSLLGAGGMGEVYRARDTRLERTIAVKILPSHIGGDPVAEWFRRSYDAASDGERFLIVRRSPDAEPEDAVVVLKWTRVLAARESR